MKSITLMLTTLFLVTFSSCKKDNLVDATITGYDGTMCACCGGLYTTVGAQKFLAAKIVDNNVVSYNSVFPVKVKIEYSSYPEYCNKATNIIKITKIGKQ